MGAIGTQAGIADAIHGQESGGRATSPTSVNGAVGGWQITPDTFQQYAHPGESISSPADNEQVGRRIVDDLSAKYGNDPARVAVGYFSGPGNVSPPGSATPWIQNHVDGNGTSTSQYVGGVLHRMGQSDPNILPASSISQPSGVTGLPDKDAAYARVLAQTADNPMAQRAALAQLDHLYAVQTKVARDNYEKAANPLVSQMISDPTKVDASRDIANNPAFNTAEKENLASMLHRQLSEASGPEKDTKTYGTGFWNYYKAVTADASDPGKITDPQVLMKAAGPGGELTVAGVDKLTGILQGKRTPEGEAEQTMMKQFLTNAKNQITGSHTGIYGDPIPDPKGDELYLKFLAHAMPAFDAGKKGGLTAPQLLDPGSKDYIGKAIATFHRPMAERMKDMDEAARNMLGTAAPGAPAAAAAPDLTTHDGIVAAYRSGKISRDAASQALVQGGFATPSTPVGVVPTN
ncbi:MAG: lytic transglycosylase domain-containing protein [Bradyrhizobium sp.]